MKKFILSGLALLFGALTMQAQNVTVIDDLSSYTGSDAYVYSKADGKTYARNNLGAYELYGVYVKTNTLNIADPTATNKVIDYIYTDNDHLAYINTGYVHQTNTRIKAVVEITQSNNSWQAIFGSRRATTSQAFAYFWHTDDSERGCLAIGSTEKKGTDMNPAANHIDMNKVITVTASEADATVSVTPSREDGPSTITSASAVPADGYNPLFIFDLSSGDDGHADGSRSRMKLYSFKIYEGETLVKDYEPIVSPEGKGGLRNKLDNNDVLFAAGSAEFRLSPDAEEKLTPGISVYPGKMVLKTNDNHIYKYNGAGWTDLGERTLGGEIASTDYKNLNNWETNEGHTGVFSGKWQATTNGYKINPYEGIGGHEPLMIQVPLEVGAEYNYSFSASWGAYNSWHDVEMHAYVCNFWDLGTQESGTSVSNSVLATQAFSFDGGTNEPFSLDFTADRAEQTLLFQFGDVDDGAKGFWFEFDNLSVKKYNYPEAYPSLNPYKQLLEALIAEVVANEPTSTVALGTALTTALNDARDVVDGEDISAQKDALDALQAAYDAAKAVDPTVLKLTAAQAQNEGVPYDSEAISKFIMNGTEKSVLDDLLAKLRADRKVNAQKQPDIYTGTAKADLVRNDEDYYLYNVGTGMWLTNGSDWDTHGAVSYAGLAIKMSQTYTGDGDFRGEESDYLLVNPWGNINFGMYLDHPDNDPWTFVDTDKANVYNIGVFDKTDDIFGYNPLAGTDGWKYWSTVTKVANASAEDQANALNQWKLVSKTERNEKLATATAENPVDATYLIKNPSLDRMQKRDDNWTHEVAGGVFNHVTFGQNGEFNRSADYGVEFWNFQTFNLSQTLTDLPAGKYIVSVNAFYRKGNSENQAAAYNNGETLESKAYLYAGDNQELLPNIATEVGKLPGIATQETKSGAFVQFADQALEAFQTGLYSVSVEAEVGEDGTLTIGVKQPEDAGAGYGDSWVVIDNFRLTYVGAPSEVTVTVDEDGMATFSSSFALDFASAKKIKAYKATTITDENIVFEEVTTAVPAGTGLLLVAEDGATEAISVATEAAALEGNLLVGTLTETEVAEGSYLLGKLDSGDVKFYKTAEGIKSAAGKAYLPAGVSGARSLTIVFADGEATGISQTAAASAEAEAVYSLTGQKLATPRKGVNVLNGKKVIVK